MQDLLEYGAAVNQPNEDGITPLHAAAFEGHCAVARMLIEKGADLDPVDNKGLTPTQHATKKGHHPFVHLLAEQSARGSPRVEATPVPSPEKEIADRPKATEAVSSKRTSSIAAMLPPAPPPDAVFFGQLKSDKSLVGW